MACAPSALKPEANPSTSRLRRYAQGERIGQSADKKKRSALPRSADPTVGGEEREPAGIVQADVTVQDGLCFQAVAGARERAI